MVALKHASILWIFALILISSCHISSAADVAEADVYYVCGEEIQEPDCTCENEVMICQQEMNYGKNFKSANVVVLKPNFFAKNVTFGRADITALKKNQIIPGRENTIEQLVISTRNLTIIENGIFDNFTALKSLSLMGTNFTNITDAVFTEKLGATLVELDLSYNEFKSLYTIDFTHLTNLKSLTLYGSKLNYTASSDVFPAALANLETLNLAKCDFEVLNTNMFEKLVNLKTLDLSANPLNAMPIAINSLPNLQNLYLDKTKITVLNNTGLKVNEKMEKLAVTSSELTTIEDCAFCSFPSLKYFNFWDNHKLEYIDENAFGFAKNGTSPKIESFSVEHCKLKIIPEKLLDWKNVKEIGVGGNMLVCNCSMAWLVNNLDDLNLVQVFTHPLEGQGYYSRYYYEEIRENNLQCYGPMALDKVHFSMISGNLCVNKTHHDHEDSHFNQAPHHVFCYVLCAIIVVAVIVAAVAYPVYQLYLKIKKGKTTNSLSYDNSNYEGDSGANNQLP